MKEAAVVIIVKDGLVLGISRRNNPNKFGLIGGKVSKGETAMEAAVRETEEETGLMIGNVFYVYSRMEPRGSPDGEDFYSHCFFTTEFVGELRESDEGHLRWMTPAELSEGELAAFGDYNSNAFRYLKDMYPELYKKIGK